MSDDEQIFFDPGSITLAEAGRRVAEALHVEYESFEDAVAFVATVEDAGRSVDVYGRVEANIYSDSAPENLVQEQIFDDMPYVLQMRTMKRQYEHQQVAAHALYLNVVDSLHWRSALTSEFSLLLAAYDSERGLRTFPHGTQSDGHDAHVWR